MGRDFSCPFSHTSCNQCVLYRGRHRYIPGCRVDQDHARESRKKGKPAGPSQSADIRASFLELEKEVEPWVDIAPLPERELKIKIRVINVESGEERVCSPEEAKQWKWDDQETVRQIDGVQIDNWDQLVQVLSFKVKSGREEVRLYEAPRFMVLAGG